MNEHPLWRRHSLRILKKYFTGYLIFCPWKILYIEELRKLTNRIVLPGQNRLMSERFLWRRRGLKIKRIFWKRRYFALSKTYIIEGLISVVVVRDVMWSKTLAEGSNPWSKFFNFFQKMVVKWPPKNPSSRGSWHNHKISSLDPDGRHQSGAQVLIGHHSWRNQKNLVYGLAKTALKKSI